MFALYCWQCSGTLKVHSIGNGEPLFAVWCCFKINLYNSKSVFLQLLQMFYGMLYQWATGNGFNFLKYVVSASSIMILISVHKHVLISFQLSILAFYLTRLQECLLSAHLNHLDVLYHLELISVSTWLFLRIYSCSFKKHKIMLIFKCVWETTLTDCQQLCETVLKQNVSLS